MPRGELGRLDILVNMASVYSAGAARRHRRRIVGFGRERRPARGVPLRARRHPPHAPPGGGRIVNFTDWVAVSGRPRYKGFLPYYVAKRGVIGLTEALALELASDQILVNAVAPGPILAPEGTTDEESKAVEAATPLGRWGGAAEIVKAVALLVETDFITGEAIRVDGGRHIR